MVFFGRKKSQNMHTTIAQKIVYTEVKKMEKTTAKKPVSVENQAFGVSQLAKPHFLTLKTAPTLNLRVGRQEKNAHVHARTCVREILILDELEIPPFSVKIHCEKCSITLFEYFDRVEIQEIENYAKKLCWLRNQLNVFLGEEIFLTSENDFEEAKYLFEIKRERTSQKDFMLLLHDVLGFIEENLNDTFFCLVDIFRAFKELSVSYVERILTELKKQEIIKVSHKQKARNYYVLNYEL